MVLCDSNVWLALTLERHVHHNVVRHWLESIVEPSSVHFCRATQHSLLRLLTMTSVMAPYGIPPLTNQQAWNAFDALLTDERIALQVREPVGVEVSWKRFANRNSVSPKLWMDAYLAAFALAGGYQMVTIDAAFAQFDGLDLVLLGSPRN